LPLYWAIKSTVDDQKSSADKIIDMLNGFLSFENKTSFKQFFLTVIKTVTFTINLKLEMGKLVKK
jgi:hypothetical protein